MAIPCPGPGSIALVTGASSGIGEEFARTLSRLGHRVAVVARREERLAELCDELGGPDRAIVIAADLAVPEDRDRLAQRLEELAAEVDILVNSAGFGVYEPFAESERKLEIQQVRVDVEAVVDLMSRYLPAMVERGRGAVINLSSASAFQPMPFSAGYAAAKAHVLFLSEAVNEELKGSGVTVTAVCPGPVPTEFEEANDAQFLQRMPGFTWVSAERVVSDALRAANRGQRSVVPGGPLVKAAFVPNRRMPSGIAVRVARRLMHNG